MTRFTTLILLSAFAVRDLLSGETISVVSRSFPLEVPAGALRILEVTKP